MHSSLAAFRTTRDEKHALSELLELYEGNYYLLNRLVPQLDAMSGTRLSRVQGAQDLYLTVLERFRYTTTVSLTYAFPEDDELIVEPNARIAIYHAARAVELLSHSRRPRIYRFRPARPGYTPQLDRKWEMNRFLCKWLRYCTHQGHLFLDCTAACVDPELLQPSR